MRRLLKESNDRATNIAILILSCAVSLLLVEVLIRVLLPPPQIVTVELASDLEVRHEFERNAQAFIRLRDKEEKGKRIFFVMTPTGRRLRANARVLIQNHWQTKEAIEIRTNDLGYRGPQVGPKQGTRILFLGDSITLGAYLNEKDTFVRRIEHLASQQGREWETVNAGVAGTSLKNALSILVETGLSTEPDVVVVGFYLNDFLDSYGVYANEPPLILSGSWLLRYIHRALSNFSAESEEQTDFTAFHASRQELRELDPIKVKESQQAYFDTLKVLKAVMYHQEHRRLSEWRSEFKEQLDADGGQSARGQEFYRLVLENFRDWGGSWSPYAWTYMRPLFEEFKRLSQLHGFKLVVACFPVRPQAESDKRFDYPQRRLAEIAGDLDVPYVDLLPRLAEAHKSGRHVFLDHCHHTAEGNDVIAETIYGSLTQVVRGL